MAEALPVTAPKMEVPTIAFPAFKGSTSPHPPVAATKLEVHGIAFPAFITPPGPSNTFFLGGAGVRGLEIGGKFITFTAIGIYLDGNAVPSLMEKWKGKTATELTESLGFFRDIITGPFEKFTKVTMILPLTGQQYADKVIENCVAYWQATGAGHTEGEVAATEKFKEVFKGETFPHGSSILFTHSPSGSLTIGFSKGGSVPETVATVIENRALAEAVLESIIGEHGVSPTAKQSLASRLSVLLNETNYVVKTQVDQIVHV